MNKSKTIVAIQLLITEAVAKQSWLWHQGQQILLSPMSLKNNIENGKYLIAFGWKLVPVDSVIARYTAEASMANKMLAEMIKEIEDSNNFFNPKTNDETVLKVVQKGE